MANGPVERSIFFTPLLYCGRLHVRGLMPEPRSTNSPPPSWGAFTRQAAAGVLILLATYFALAFIPFRVIVLAYIAHVVGAGLMLVFLLVAASVAGVGVRLSKPGLAWSPLIFCLLWLGASIAHRAGLALSSDVQAGSGSLPGAADLAGGSLTVDGGVPYGILKLLAEQRVRQVVGIERSADRPVVRKATVHRRGPACRDVETVNTTALKEAGRLDECFTTDFLVADPDGVIIRMTSDGPRLQVGLFIVKHDGDEREVARWTSQGRITLAYLPVLGFGFGTVARPQGGVWSGASGGPFQVVYLGRPPFTATDMTEAVARIGLSDPIGPASVPPAELVQRAVGLLEGHYTDRLSAMKLVESARKLGYVDDGSLAVAAASFGERLYTPSLASDLNPFWMALDEGRKRRLLDRVFARLSDPALATWRFDCEDVFAGPREMVREHIPSAADIFRSRSGLGRWQHECALRFVHLAATEKGFDDATYRGVQRETFVDLADDASSSFPTRALAFCKVFFLHRSAEVRLFSRRLAMVPDPVLGDFIRQCGWHPSVRPDPNDADAGPATEAFRTAARDRIALVGDETIRRDLLSRFK